MRELTLAVVGIDFRNEDGSNRRSEAVRTPPGAPIELVPAPKNEHDPNAIAVFSPQGVQSATSKPKCATRSGMETEGNTGHAMRS